MSELLETFVKSIEEHVLPKMIEQKLDLTKAVQIVLLEGKYYYLRFLTDKVLIYVDQPLGYDFTKDLQSMVEPKEGELATIVGVADTNLVWCDDPSIQLM